MPCLHYVTMALSLNHSRAVAKAAGKAKAKAKTKVKARTRATAKAKQRVRTAAKNQRRGERRRCVQKLNELAAEVGAPRIHLDRRAASGPEFDRVKTGLRQGDPQGDPGGIRGDPGPKRGIRVIHVISKPMKTGGSTACSSPLYNINKRQRGVAEARKAFRFLEFYLPSGSVHGLWSRLGFLGRWFWPLTSSK